MEQGRHREQHNQRLLFTPILAATNTPLELLLREGRFRADLYYRINIIRIEVPSLRERREDIVPLVDLFLRRASERIECPVLSVSPVAMRRLVACDWPGNVRELANTIERAVALCDHNTILPQDVASPDDAGVARSLVDTASKHGVRLRDLEQTYIRRVLEAHAGNKAAAARALGVSRRTLYRKMEG
ncbi:MAG: helix-turn-helix domain-containing protein [Pseudomonadota bacterium]